jgi:DNA-binding transcriptional regulator YdaS (Cro superfamily)
MRNVIDYLNGLTTEEQQAFAKRCGTSVGYLRKAASVGQKLGESLCINIERETAGAIRVESIRPDVDWQFIRQTVRQ